MAEDGEHSSSASPSFDTSDEVAISSSSSSALHEEGLGLLEDPDGSDNYLLFGTFCNEDNKEERFEIVRKEFLALNRSMFLTASAGSTTLRLDVVSLINMCYDLLRLHSEALHHNEALTDSLSKSSNEISRLSRKCSSLRETVDIKDRIVRRNEEKIRQLEVVVRSLDDKLRKEREENRKLASVLDHRMNQFRHEQRKKEKQIEQMREKLGKILSDVSNKSQATPLQTIEIINELPRHRTNGQRKRWRTPLTARREERELNSMMGMQGAEPGLASNHEIHRKELLDEIQGLSKHLTDAQEEIAMIFEQLKIESVPSRSGVVTPASITTEEQNSYSEVGISCKERQHQDESGLTDANCTVSMNADDDGCKSFAFAEPYDFKNNVVDALRFLRSQIAVKYQNCDAGRASEENVNNNIPCQSNTMPNEHTST